MLPINDDLLVVVVTFLGIPDIYRNVCGVSKKFRSCSLRAVESYDLLRKRRDLLEKLWNIYNGRTTVIESGLGSRLNLTNLTPKLYILNNKDSFYKSFSNIVEYYDYISGVDEYLKDYYDGHSLTEMGEMVCLGVFNTFSENGLMNYRSINRLNRLLGVKFQFSTYDWLVERYDTLDGCLTFVGYRTMFMDNFDRVPLLMYGDLKKLEKVRLKGTK